MAPFLTIREINELDDEKFIRVLGGVVEHGGLIIGALCSYRPFKDLHHLYSSLCDLLNSLSTEFHASILRCHPDLAGRLAASGELTPESTREQRSAGLDVWDEADTKLLQQGNEAYRGKFQFPFVICVRENKKDSILCGLSSRICNTLEEELIVGIEEVKKISLLRIYDIIINPKRNLPSGL